MTKRKYDLKEVASRLKELRSEKGITQKQLAEAINFSVSTIKQYEAGNRIPEADNLSIICKYYKVNPDYILGVSDFKDIYDFWDSSISVSDLSFGSKLCEWFSTEFDFRFADYTEAELKKLEKDIKGYIKKRIKTMKGGKA